MAIKDVYDGFTSELWTVNENTATVDENGVVTVVGSNGTIMRGNGVLTGKCIRFPLPPGMQPIPNRCISNEEAREILEYVTEYLEHKPKR